MTPTTLLVRPDRLDVRWPDASTTSYPTLWLRDNCPSGLHPDTQERMLDLLAIDANPVLETATQTGDMAVLRFADGHVSQMPMALLDAHRPGQRSHDAGDVPAKHWRADHGAENIGRYPADALLISSSSAKVRLC